MVEKGVVAAASGGGCALEAALRRAVRALPPGALVAACSGGVDSLALLLGLHAVLGAQAAARRLVVVHVHHGLRGAGADRDADAVARIARSLGLRSDVVRVRVRRRVAGRRLSPEEAARCARYGALAEAARRHGARAVLCAHHRDDQAETVLLRVLRGCGIEGLAAMAPVRPIDRTPGAPLLVRPLLALSRAELRAFVAATGVAPRVDPTNLEIGAAARNGVRLRLRPWLERRCPDLGERLCRLAACADRLRSAVRRAARARLRHARLLAAARPPHPPALILAPAPLEGPRVLDRVAVRALRQSAAWLRPAIVRAWLRECTGTALSRRHTEALLALLVRARGGGAVALSHGLAVRREHDALVLEALPAGASRPPAPTPVRAALRARGTSTLAALALRVHCRTCAALPGRALRRATPRCVYLDLDAIGERPLVLRTPRPGDRMHPLGVGGSKKLKALFIDARVAAPLRPRVLVLEAGGEIAWVPGLRVDARFAATARSRRVLAVEIVPLGATASLPPSVRRARALRAAPVA